MMTDEQFTAAVARYREHMARFLSAHPAGSPPMDALRDLERRERWRKMMGAAATVLDAPTLAELEKG